MYIMLLNDQETYTDLKGCELIHVPDGYTDEQIQDGIRNEDPRLVTIRIFGDEPIPEERMPW